MSDTMVENNQNVNTAKCLNCGGPLRFDPKSDQAVCDNCGSQFPVSHRPIEEMQREIEHKKVSWVDWSTYDLPDSSEEAEAAHDGKRHYECPSCGAEITTDENTVATKCPYCDNNVVLKDRTVHALKPHAVIPFQITKKELPGILSAFFKTKKFLPRSFKKESKYHNITGIYVPYWLFDCKMEGEMELSGERVHTYRQGDYRVTQTDHWLLKRYGDMDFEKVPVDGSVRMDDALMESVEPYDYSGLRDYDDLYLSGFLAEKYDEDPTESLPKASERMINTAVQQIMQGESFLNVRLKQNQMSIKDAAVRYVLLPVYVFHNTYHGKDYAFAVNGQTGKAAGELPISKGKMAAVAGAISAAIGAVGAIVAWFMLH